MYTLQGIAWRKPVYWITSSKKDLKEFPEAVQSVIGRYLLSVQLGYTPRVAKPLHGFGGASVLEIVEDFEGNAYRAVYTIKFKDAVYVLHCFQKKSTHGIATPRHEIELIRDRLRLAEEHHRSNQGEDT